MLTRLLDLINQPENNPKGKINLHNHLCLNVRTGRQLCSSCVDVCPVQGIEQKGNRVEIKDCIACGLCAVACPTGVMDELWDAVAKVISAGKDPRPCLWISCHNTAPIKDALKINCLGELTPELILYLLKRDISKLNILYQPEVCKGCSCHSGQTNWNNTWQKLARIYPPEANCFQVQELAPEFIDNDQQPVDYTRRGFLRSFTREAQQVAAQLLLEETVDKENNPFAQSLSLRRKLFTHIVSHLDPDQAKILEPGYLRHPEIGPDCSFCNSCATLCPSGAMKMVQRDDSIQLSVDPTVCNMCGLCAAICPARAIIVDWAIPNDAPPQRIPLLEGERQRCSQCGQHFWSCSDTGQPICMRCSNNRNKPRLTWHESTM